MDHLDQATIDDNATEVNLAGYAQLYDGVKALATDLHETFKDILSEIDAKSETEQDPIFRELRRELNIDGASFKSSPEDLSKEDIINFYEQTKAFAQNLFAKANYLLDIAGTKAKELNADMVQKVPMYKFYRSVGMLFLTTSIGLSAILSTFASDESLDTAALRIGHKDGSTMSPVMMNTIARYLNRPEFIKQVFGVNADILNLSIDFGRIIGEVGGYNVQLTVKAREGDVFIRNDSYTSPMSRGPEEGDEFNFDGYTMGFNASGELSVSTFDYPESPADILQALGIEDVDATKVRSIKLNLEVIFIVNPYKQPNEPNHVVISGDPQISVTTRSEVEADDPDTFRYDGEIVEDIRTIYIPKVEFDGETGLPENLMGEYAAIIDYIARKYPHIRRSD